MDKADNLQEITGETLNALPHLHHPKYTIHNQHGIKKSRQNKTYEHTWHFNRNIDNSGKKHRHNSWTLVRSQVKKPAQQFDSC